MKKVKVLIVDDANMSREMLKMVIEKEERYEVVLCGEKGYVKKQ